MKQLLSICLLSCLALSFVAQADVLCVRKKEKTKANGSGFQKNFKVFSGSACPKGFPGIVDTSIFQGAVGVAGQTQNYYFTSTINSCTQFEYRFDVTTPPGLGNSWRFYLESRSSAGVSSGQIIACQIIGTSRSCTGTGTLDHPAGNSLNVVSLANSGSPASTRAGWAIRCISNS